jgi:hypothetical protein
VADATAIAGRARTVVRAEIAPTVAQGASARAVVKVAGTKVRRPSSRQRS